MPVRVGRMMRVADVIASAVRQGCELRKSKAQLATPHGQITIRYLVNPATKGRFDITDYEDDEHMLESEIAAAERRLSIAL